MYNVAIYNGKSINPLVTADCYGREVLQTFEIDICVLF